MSDRRRGIALIVVPIVFVAVFAASAFLGRRKAVQTYSTSDLPGAVYAGRASRGESVRVVFATPNTVTVRGLVASFVPGSHPSYPVTVEFHFREPPPASFSSVFGTVSEFRPDLRPRLSRVPGVVVVTDCAAE